MTPTRLTLITLITLLLGAPTLRAEPRELGWDDLVPRSAAQLEEDGTLTPYPSSGTVPELNGVEVKLPGFVVPLDMTSETVSSFLLVPYFGACIHQPPPPPNQTVYVTLEDAIAMETMYYPVWVTGTLATERNSSDLAEAGYTMTGLAVERFEY
ncbi:MAG: DUF3299 domain-containing protein [Pseudomonadota bacterium]